MILLKPSEMKESVVFSTTKSIWLHYLHDWNYGHIVLVNDLNAEVGYVYGQSKLFPAGTKFSFANGGMSNMVLDVTEIE
jgi:hypothetical protein